MVSFPLTLTAIFVLATGVCALQTSANPYVSILGPEHSAPARLNLAQAFNSWVRLRAVGCGHFILTDPSKVAQQGERWRTCCKGLTLPLPSRCWCWALR